MQRGRSGGRKDRRGSRGARLAEAGPRVRSAPATGSGDSAALQFTRLNWILLGSAAVLIVLGFFALSSSSPVASTIVAPLLLVASYGVLIPAGLIA